jgi:hypothetical protein
LSTDQVIALSTAQVSNLTTAMMVALTTAQVQAIETLDIQALKTSQLATLATATVQALSTDQVIALQTSQVANLTTAGIYALTTSQIQAIETLDIQALQTGQLASLATAQAEAFTTQQVEALSTAQIHAIPSGSYSHLTTGTPIILDLNGDGVRTLGIDAGVKFDLFADGGAISTGWVSGGDGLLVLDRNHDGQINDGTELFGSATKLSNGQTASDGYAALRELDANNDGVISSEDAVYADLRVWVDSNSDGVSGAGETKTLASLGISKINLNAAVGTGTDNGNILGLTSTYETTDGQTHDAADVWFLADRTGANINTTSTSPTSVDSAIAALNVTSNPPVVGEATVSGAPVVDAALVIPLAVLQPVPEPAALNNDLRSKVSGLAQAIGTFADAGVNQMDAPVPMLAAINSGASSATPATLAMVSMVDTMKQFDANGNPFGTSVASGASTNSPLTNVPGLQNPASTGILTTGGKT